MDLLTSNYEVLLLLEQDQWIDLEKDLSTKQVHATRISLTQTVPIQHNTLFWQSICQIKQYDWIVFLEEVQTELFFSLLLERRIDVRGLGHLKFAAANFKVEQALLKRGLFPAFSVHTKENDFVERFIHTICPKERLLIPIAKQEESVYVQKIADYGIACDGVPVMQTVPTGQPLPQLCEKIVVVLDKTTDFYYLLELLKNNRIEDIKVVTLSEIAQQKAQEQGFFVVMPQRVTKQGILRAITSIGGVLNAKEENNSSDWCRNGHDGKFDENCSRSNTKK